MILVKVLERKIVIQFFGLAFFLAPAINTILSMSLQLVENKWTYHQLSKVLGAQTFSNNILSLCSIVLGITMLSGSKKSWRFALGLIGIHIVMQLPKLGQDLRTSWIYGLGFLVNVGTFLFIGDQLVFKQKSQEIPTAEPLVAMPDPVVAPVTEPIQAHVQSQAPTVKQVISRKKILVSFKGEKPWAQIAKIDSDGIELKQLGERPENLENRQVEISLGAHLNLKMKYSSELGNHLHFKYANATAFELRQLNSWLSQQSL
jgi:hypothetical protein